MAVAVDLNPEPSPSRLSISCDAKALRAAISRLAKCADPRSAIPALTSILVVASGADVMLAATDLVADVRVHVPARVGSAGSILAPAPQLQDALRHARGDVTLQDSGAALHVQSVNAGWFVMPAGDASDFPALPNPPAHTTATIPCDVLARMVSRIVRAMSTDETRPHLAGAFFERADGVLHAVATDGHRLAHAHRANDGAPFDLLVHRRGVEEVNRWIPHIDGDVRITSADGRAFFVATDATISTRVVEGSFPSWRRVVPSSCDSRVTVSRDEFRSALRAIKIRGVGGVRIDLTEADAITVSTSTPDHESAVRLAATIKGPAPKRIAFNHRYLTDVVDSTDDDEMTIEMCGELDPCIVRASEGSESCVMPMRV